MAKEKYMWAPNSDMLVVAAAAREALANGKSRLQALEFGQSLLPKSKHFPPQVLARRAKPWIKMLDHAIERVNEMSPEQVIALTKGRIVPTVDTARDKPFVPMRNTKMLPADYKGHAPVSWTKWECALIARWVDYWLAMGSNAGLARLVQEAQERVCPTDRRRPRASLMVNVEKYLRPLIEQGRLHQHLIAHIPFDPMQMAWQDPKAEMQPAAPQPQESPQERAPVKTAPIPPVDPPLPQEEASRPAPEASPQVVRPVTQAHESARKLGIGLANALVPLIEEMLVAHEQQVVARMEERRKAENEELALRLLSKIGGEISRILGGPSTPPEPMAATLEPEPDSEPPEDTMARSQALAQAEADAQPPRAPRLKLDVVGLDRGHQQMRVKYRLNGHADDVDIRWVSADDKFTYQPVPGRQVIVLRGRCPHALTDLIRSRGIKPYYVERTVQDVVVAIENLLQQQQGA